VLAPRRKILIILCVASLAALVAASWIRRSLPARTLDERAVLELMAPETRFGPKGGVPPHFPAGDGSAAFDSYDIVPAIRGYAGPIKVLVHLDRQGRIEWLKILEHHETKNYVHRLETPEFLNQFNGKSIRDPFRLDEDVDGISRATVTVQALADTLRESGRIVGRDVLGLNVPGSSRGAASFAGALAYALLFCVAAAGFHLSKWRERFLRLRDVSLAASLGVVGIWLASPFSILHILNVIMVGISTHALWYVAVAGIFMTFVLWGRFYCGWLCPFGALAEFLDRLPTRRWDVQPGFEAAWRNAKYVVLILAVLTAAAAGTPDSATFETYVTLFSRSGSWPAWALVFLAILAEFRISRFWCRYLCPVGAVGALLSRNEPGYPSRSDCPMVNPRHPLGAECIRCNRCRYKMSGTPVSGRGPSHD